MINQIYSEINQNCGSMISRHKAKSLLVDIFSLEPTEISKKKLASNGYGKKLVNSIFSALKKAGYFVSMRKKDKSGRYIKDGVIYRFAQKGIEVLKYFGKKISSVGSSVALPYVQAWNAMIKEQNLLLKPIYESTAKLFNPDILSFEQVGGSVDIFKDAVSELLSIPYFRGELGKKPLQFEFILNPENLKKFLSGVYFDRTKVQPVEQIETLSNPVKQAPQREFNSTPPQRQAVPSILSQEATPERQSVPAETKSTDEIEKINQFNHRCKKYYPKPGASQLPDSRKIEVMKRIPTEKDFKYTCEQAKNKVSSERYLPKPSNFFDPEYSNNYLQYAPEPKPTGKLDRNHDQELLKKLIEALSSKYPLRSDIFTSVDIRIAPEQNIFEIRGEEFHLQWLQDNHFDVKIQRILIQMSGKRFDPTFIN